MRVLIFSLAYLPFIGGAELAVKEITDRISGISAKGGPASGWEFDLITVNLDGKQKSQEKIGNATIYRLGQGKLVKYFFPWIAAKKAQELQQQKNYQAIWAIMANQAGLAALFFKQKNPKIKYILTLQEGDSLKRIWSRTILIRPLYRKIYQKADAITAISHFLAKRAKKFGYRGKISIVPNGVDLENFKKTLSDTEKVELKKDLNIGEHQKVVVTVSRLVHKNGVDTIIKSIKDLPVKLLILGEGKLKIKFQALVQEIGVRDNVVFLGYVKQKDIPKYLAIADVFVRCSRSEGLGSAFLEAMVAGVPVIGTKVGGIPEFLKDGETGLFCEVNNPRDLAAKIKLILNEEKLRQNLIKNAASFVNERYDWSNISRQTKEVFEL